MPHFGRQVLADAADRTPWGDLRGHQHVAGHTRNEVVSEHMRAIWDALQERGFTYINAPQASTSTNAQNIKFPSATYEDATGNCIELVVMLASVMEAIGFTANLIYIPGLAWIGVDQSPNDATVLPFETTVLGHAAFDSAAGMATSDGSSMKAGLASSSMTLTNCGAWG